MLVALINMSYAHYSRFAIINTTVTITAIIIIIIKVAPVPPSTLDRASSHFFHQDQ